MRGMGEWVQDKVELFKMEGNERDSTKINLAIPFF
jgi:hypothetical protein